MRCIGNAALAIVELDACWQSNKTDYGAILDLIRSDIDAMVFVNGFSASDWKSK